MRVGRAAPSAVHASEVEGRGASRDIVRPGGTVTSTAGGGPEEVAGATTGDS